MSEIQSENHRKTDIKSMDLAELKAFMTSIGEKPFRASQIYQWMHVRHVSSWDEMTNLSKALREKLKEQAELTVLEPVTIQTSKLDGTKKYLFRLPDGNMIESVLMRYKHGNSVCISSQAGCRMGCRFCASTLDGLVRGLTPAEMLEQIYRVGEDIGERISNVVVMGTGEPMDKAGAYGVQSRGALFVERIDGDFFNVMGLPVEQLGLVLARFGVKLL